MMLLLDALKVLASEGLVVLKPRRITSADFSRLAVIHEDLEQLVAANSADRFFEANQHFRKALRVKESTLAGQRIHDHLLSGRAALASST